MLKRIIKRLHSGEDPKKVKEEFAEFLSKVTPLEIAKTRGRTYQRRNAKRRNQETVRLASENFF